VPAGSNDNDIKEMFAHVIERLDAIQDENRDLKDNIRNLVERLEQYDQYDSQRYLESPGSDDDHVNNNAMENGGNPTVTEQEGNIEGHVDENHDAEETDNVIGDVEEENSETEENQSERVVDEAPYVSESAEANNNDMREYSKGENESSQKGDDEIQQIVKQAAN